eukprot:scpid105257/ scgid0934/ 
MDFIVKFTRRPPINPADPAIELSFMKRALEIVALDKSFIRIGKGWYAPSPFQAEKEWCGFQLSVRRGGPQSETSLTLTPVMKQLKRPEKEDDLEIGREVYTQCGRSKDAKKRESRTHMESC